MSKTNSVRLLGFLGNAPKFINTKDENAVLSVSMATHETVKGSDGGKVKQTEWHNLVAFGKVAILINDNLKKGSRLQVWGRLQTRQYVDKQGNDRYRTEIVVNEVLFLDNLPENEG